MAAQQEEEGRGRGSGLVSLLLRDDGGLGRLEAEFRNLERRSLSKTFLTGRVWTRQGELD